MRKLLLTAALVGLVAVVAGPAAGAGKGGGPVATISFASSEARILEGGLHRSDAVSFAVDPVRVKDRDLYRLWVANWCYQGGEAVSAEFVGVTYAEYRQGWAGGFMLDGPNWGDGGATCTAYVWKFPSTHDPLPGASMTYSVEA